MYLNIFLLVLTGECNNMVQEFNSKSLTSETVYLINFIFRAVSEAFFTVHTSVNMVQLGLCSTFSMSKSFWVTPHPFPARLWWRNKNYSRRRKDRSIRDCMSICCTPAHLLRLCLPTESTSLICIEFWTCSQNPNSGATKQEFHSTWLQWTHPKSSTCFLDVTGRPGRTVQEVEITRPKRPPLWTCSSARGYPAIGELDGN